MSGWVRHQGLAVALPIEGIDTDQLIPARFMSRPRKAGYGDYLLHDLRRLPDGTPDPAFALNRAEAAGASILVAPRNFGAGSSREAAVYALLDAGFRAVIAPSFGDIFARNAVNNGLLPARLPEAAGLSFLAELETGPAQATVDLKRATVTLGDLRAGFELDDVAREKLMRGWDDIDLTRRHSDAIAAHRARLQDAVPWLWPRAQDA